ncbi:COG1470 family protein [Pedobacter sp. AW31-3R]|uniref:COG1470 family protein n=1 Tax=Pedobacter sp. AW31-3R TaxID=3445781 RepID=UPI003F9ED478
MPIRFKNILLITLSLVLLLIHTALGQGISLSPSRLFFSGKPGETLSQTINFSNTSEKVFTFTTRIQNFERDSLGIKYYFSGDTIANSNVKWLSLSSGNIVIQPGEKKSVTVTMNVPKEVPKQTHSMVFFTQAAEQTPRQSSGVALGMVVLLEMGVQVYYTPSGLPAGDLEFISFTDLGNHLDEAHKRSRRLAIKIHNTGAINKDAFVRFELTNKDTGEEIKIKPENVAMLPDATQVVILNLPADLKGKFLVVALLDAGESYDLKVAEKEITYPL